MNEKSKIQILPNPKQIQNPKSKTVWDLEIGIYLVVLVLLGVGIFLTGCEQVDPESLNRITQEDPSFKAVLEKKQELDGKIGLLSNQLKGAKADTYAKINALQDNFNKNKSEIDSKITALKNELEPQRLEIRREIDIARSRFSGKKAILKDLEATRRNLTNLINQQKAVSVTEEDMAKWQGRLEDLNEQIEPLMGEVRELEEKIRLLRIKLIALRQ